MLFENMTFADFSTVANAKVHGAWNLHHALLSSPLDFFITLSSVAGIVGNRGQAAYSSANVFLDGFMAWRRSQGLPGMSIDLAAVSNVGYLAEGTGSGRQEEVLRNIGSESIDEAEVLALLAACLIGIPGDSTQCITGLGISDPSTSLSTNFWIHDSKFTSLREVAESLMSSDMSTNGKAAQSIPLSQLLKSASSPTSAVPLIVTALIAKLSTVLGIPIEDMEPTHSVSSLVLDSLVGVEIRNWIARETGANVQVLELLSSSSLNGLAEIIAKKSNLVKKDAAE